MLGPFGPGQSGARTSSAEKGKGKVVEVVESREDTESKREDGEDEKDEEDDL